MDEPADLRQTSRGSVGRVLLLAAWLALIFGTSCTVVLPFEFFEFVRTHILVDDAWFERFRVFWGLSWFVIVKRWHATEFGLLLLCCMGAVQWWSGQIDQKVVAWSMLFCILFAISDEWHQSFIPDRLGTVSDVLIDSLGISVVGLSLLRRTRSLTADRTRLDETGGSA